MPPVYIISTVGQSVFVNAGNPIKAQASEFGRQTLPDHAAILRGMHGPPGDSLYQAMLAHLEGLQSAEALRAASAELNSLDRLLAEQLPNNNDVLCFLASDTPDGALAARVLADFCQDYFRRSTQAQLIPGLQVNDAARFRREGLPALIDALYDRLEQAPAETYRRVLNPTGGFKGVVPYLTVVGMLEAQVEVSYIYERSPELITLAGLPIALDYERLGAHYSTLAVLNEAGQLNETDLRSELAWPDRPLAEHPAWPLFEAEAIDGGWHYALGGLGLIAFRYLRQARKHQPVWLSMQAEEAYQRLSPSEQRVFGMIFNLLADPDWREQRRDSKHGIKGEAIIYKRRASKERLLYFWDEAQGCVLIAELLSHGDGSYESAPDPKRKDYDYAREWKL